MTTRDRRFTVRVEVLALRGLMIAMAIATVLVGASLLTTPVAVPFTIALWLGAAAMAALGVWGRLPDE